MILGAKRIGNEALTQILTLPEKRRQRSPRAGGAESPHEVAPQNSHADYPFSLDPRLQLKLAYCFSGLECAAACSLLYAFQAPSMT